MRFGSEVLRAKEDPVFECFQCIRVGLTPHCRVPRVYCTIFVKQHGRKEPEQPLSSLVTILLHVSRRERGHIIGERPEEVPRPRREDSIALGCGHERQF